MKAEVRRVVTGHDAEGKAVVKIDGISPTSPPREHIAVVWSTEGFPVDNSGDQDDGVWEGGITRPNGTVFRVVSFQPGNSPLVHRTDTIDYAVVISGEIDMELDDSVVHLKPGDVLVQRGTIHNWANKGAEPCVIAFAQIHARSAAANGTVLEATIY